ncbi:MAG: hypothetical protein JW809_10145, partial [Pirellulales bacterium]|nr:hypothetical protein [Pirellulales bacterium]
LAALDALILWQCRRRLSRFTRRGLSRFSHSENGTIPLSPDSKPVMPSEAKHLANPNPDEILRRAQDDGGLAHDNRRCLFHRPRHPAPLLLALAAATALVLSAIQVFPSAVFARLSNRADATAPRSVWEIPSAFHLDDPAKRIADGLLCRRLDGESHARHAYHFSVGPWRWAEYVWPNFSGRQFPIHRRWIAAVPAEGRVWTPSLYMGVVPLLLALSALRPRRGRPAVAWMSWTAVLAVLAALGWYGLGWLAAECRAACGITADGGTLGYPVGGLYWLMTVLLPGYVYFRYPAKLLVVAALALGVLAARGWDAAFRHDSPRPRRAFAALGGISLVGAAAAFATRPWWPGWFAAAEPDVLFGPLDASGAAADLSFGLLQTAVVCGLAWWLLSLRWASGCAPALLDEPAVAPGAPANRRRWIPAAMLALVCVDLAVANGWMVVAAPAELWRAPSRLVQAIRADRARRGETGPVRVWRHPTWLPTSWKAAGSPDRLAESVAWDRDTLRPKYNLPERIGGVEVYGSMMPAAYRRFLAEHSPDEIMAATGAEYAILPPGETLPGGRPVSEEAKDVSLWYRDATHDPRAAAALPNNSVLRARLSTALACGATLSGLGWLGLVGFALTRRRWR